MSTEGAPLEYVFHAAGPAATPTLRLAWALLALTIVVAVIVSALLVGALVRRRSAVAPDTLEGESGGMKWVWIGTGLSTLGLFGALVYVLVTLESVAMPPHPAQLSLQVTAYDWWWRIDYPDPAHAASDVVTANEIHIPVGEPVRIVLHSADVIHAFWVPQLAGKTQAIPGLSNEQWIQADHPGIYRGQCTQFCGEQHAHMSLEVVAQPRAEFETWLAAQRQPAHDPVDAQAQAGRHVFGDRCAACHTVRGTDALGVQGPDLTHLNSRRTIAADTLINNEANQLDWIAHAQQIKPDSLMPSISLSTADATALSAYLRTLR
jgi:cytochrome c oxidase subunit 2